MNSEYLSKLGFSDIDTTLAISDVGEYLSTSNFELARDYIEKHDVLVGVMLHRHFSFLSRYTMHTFFYIYRIDNEIFIVILHRTIEQNNKKEYSIVVRDYNPDMVESLKYEDLSIDSSSRFHRDYLGINIDERKIKESFPALANDLFTPSQAKSARK